MNKEAKQSESDQNNATKKARTQAIIIPEFQCDKKKKKKNQLFKRLVLTNIPHKS